MQTSLGRFARFHGRRGFTFIEIMIVVVIIGLLAGAVAWKASSIMDTARVNRARSDIATIVNAVEVFNLNNGRYPTTDEGLEKLPLKNHLDPWGNPYGYNCPAQDEPFEVFSLGADGRQGGDGITADVYSWQLGEKPKGS